MMFCFMTVLMKVSHSHEKREQNPGSKFDFQTIINFERRLVFKFVLIKIARISNIFVGLNYSFAVGESSFLNGILYVQIEQPTHPQR
jgi:hypothetical protein